MDLIYQEFLQLRKIPKVVGKFALRMKLKFLLGIVAICFMFMAPSTIFKLKSGHVEFISKAPMETIRASTNAIRGGLQLSNNSFSFNVDMNSFEGFNSDLQKQHFIENYLDASEYPTASFKGKIIDAFEITSKEKITVRAKGKFEVHGISSEMIVPVTIQIINEKQFSVNANFKIDLASYNIAIPRVVSEKLSKYVDVSVKCTLQSL